MPSVSKRSIIKFGRDGLVVTLPKAWADYYELKPSDKVEVIVNKKLTIQPIKVKKKGGN